MSFGLSGGAQGNVRYALILDDQDAIKKLTEFKTSLVQLTQPSQALVGTMGSLGTSFTSMGTTTKTLGTDLKTMGTGMIGLASPTQTVNTSMGALSNNFKLLSTTVKTDTTDINAFRTATTALTAPTQTVTANMKSMVGTMGPLASNFEKNTGAAKDMIVQQTKVGSSVKDNVSRFATFGASIGTTVFSLVNLVRQYRDVNDQQIAVDRTTRKLSLADEAVKKETDKLAAVTKKYGENSKEAKAQSINLTQALQNQSVQSRQVGEAQEALRDTQENLAFTTGTTLLSTVTTGISGFRDFGLSVKGGIPHLKSFGHAITGLGGSLVVLKGSLIAIAAPLAALAGGIIIGNTLKQQIPQIEEFSDSIDDMVVHTADQLGVLGEAFKGYREFMIKTFPQFATEAEKASIGLGNLTKAGEGMIKWITPAIDKTATYEQQINDITSGTGLYTAELIQLTAKAGGYTTAAQAEVIATKNLFNATDPLQKLYKLFPASVGRAATEVNNLSTANTGLATSTASVGTAVKAGTDRLGEYVTKTGDSIIENNVFREGLIKIATEQFNIANATSLTTSELDLQIRAAKGDTEAIKALNDELEKVQSKRFELAAVFKVDTANEQLEKFQKQFRKMLPDKLRKKIELDLELGLKEQAFRQHFESVVAQATVMSDSAADKIGKTLVKQIDKGFKGKSAEMTQLKAELQAAIADPNTPEALKTLLTGFDFGAVGTEVGTKTSTGFETGFSGGNAPAIKSVDVVANRIMTLENIIPQVSLMNNNAIKAIDVIVKRIDSLEKLKPQINLQNNKAIKAVDVVAKRIDSLEKIKPQINLQNKDAIKAVDVVARRINDLNQTVTVRVKTVGGGVNAQGGFQSSSLPEDTTIFAHKGESVRIGHGGGGSSGSGGGGWMQGDLIVNNIIDMRDDRFVRSFRKRLGTNRYQFGA